MQLTTDDSNMRVLRLIRTLLWEHPVLWVALGIPLFAHLSRLPINSWNVEMLIARNILSGFGFVVAPLDPPALWRPPLAVAFLLPIERLFSDPQVIYSIFGSLTLVGLLASVFYLMKTLGGKVAAHFSQLIILSTPAFTTAVSQQLQLLSYLLLFSLVTVSILTTLWSWERTGWKRDLMVGLCWGVAFLARPEAMLLFGASLFSGIAFHRSLGMTHGRAGLRFVLQLAAFLAIYEPSVLIFKSAQERYNIVGQESLITYYAGAHFASNQLTGDVDGEGYLETVARFGRPEKYHNSMIRFMLANPSAIYVRIGQNVSNFRKLIESNQVLNVWDCLAFLALASVLVFARPPSIPPRPLLAYMTLLLMVSPYFLVFHMDVRYSLLFVMSLILWILVIALVFWTWIGSRFAHSQIGKALFVLPTIGVVILCDARLNIAVSTARARTVDITPWQQLATSFRANVGPEGTPVVGFFAPDGTQIFGGDFLWFTYFARTALPWCGNPTCDTGNAFPRSRIYSFLGKPAEYIWITDERVPAIKTITNRVVVQHIQISGMGAYSLIRPMQGVGDVNAAIANAVIVNAAEYEARFVENPAVDKVSCAPLGLVPDGKPDGMIEVDRQAPKPPVADSGLLDGLRGLNRKFVRLQRTLPAGTYATSNLTYILGVSATPDGPLLNGADGSVSSISQSPFYLHFCRDGHDTADSLYQVDIEGQHTSIAVTKK